MSFDLPFFYGCVMYCVGCLSLCLFAYETRFIRVLRELQNIGNSIVIICIATSSQLLESIFLFLSANDFSVVMVLHVENKKLDFDSFWDLFRLLSTSDEASDEEASH